MAEQTRDLGSYYDEYYFLQNYDVSGEPYHRDNPVWQKFFGHVADRIVAELQPRTVLDAGCGIGLLVEALRDRGVEAFGIDISEYAIEQVREGIRPYVQVGSVTDELERDYDLIVCMEVLEHLPPELGEQAVENLTRHTDDIVFSSSPDDFREPSHLNVQPTDYWVAHFARHGFYRDVDFDASFVAKHAIRFTRIGGSNISVLRAYEREHYRAASELFELRSANMAAVEERARLERERARVEEEREQERKRAVELGRHAAELESHAAGLERHAAQLEHELETWRGRAETAEQRVAEWEAYRVKAGWRIYVALAALRLRLAPLGTRRDRVVRLVFGALATAVEALYRAFSRGAATSSPGLVQLAVGTAPAPHPPVDMVRAAPPMPSLDEQYEIWLEQHTLDDDGARRIREEARELLYQPRISILTPVYNTDPAWLRAAVESVRGQLYKNWELCIADDRSTRPETLSVLREYEQLDARIKATRLDENSGISAASNAALSLATGEFVGLLDHDDELKPDALFEVAKLLNERPTLGYVYSDEDKRDVDGSLVSAFFKPDWSPDLLLSANYVTHFSVFRKDVVERVGGFRPPYDGSQDYDLVLRITEVTDEIGHIAKPLYTWRKSDVSAAGATDAKPFAYEAAKSALADALRRRGIEAFVLTGVSPGFYRVKYAIQGDPKVSIVIPAGDRLDSLRRCVASIEERTAFANYEIVIVHDETADRATVDFLHSFSGRVVACPGDCNLAAMMNRAAGEADGEALLFLTPDAEVISSEWLDAMLEHGHRDDVGAVGARLIHPDGRVHHEGVVIGGGRVARNVDTRDYFRLGRCVRNWSAVSSECMLTRRDVFSELGGLDERFSVAFDDVDYCLRLRERGYLVVYTPYAFLFQHGDGRQNEAPEDGRRWAERWNPSDFRDPYYNPNLSLDDPFTIRIDGRS